MTADGKKKKVEKIKGKRQKSVEYHYHSSVGLKKRLKAKYIYLVTVKGLIINCRCTFVPILFVSKVVLTLKKKTSYFRKHVLSTYLIQNNFRNVYIHYVCMYVISCIYAVQKC